MRVAYRDVIAAGRHPVVALYLELPPEELDVNVHPAKAEVRFRDAGAVRALVIGALEPRAGDAGPAARRAMSVASTAAPGALAPGLRPAAAVRRRAGFGRGTRWRLPPRNCRCRAARRALAGVVACEHPLGAPVAQVLDTYIIAVAGDGRLVLVDQHAAHERLTHEALARGDAGRAACAPSRCCCRRWSTCRRPMRPGCWRTPRRWRALGLEIEAFGAGAVLVRALPAALGAPEPAPLLRDLADELAERGRGDGAGGAAGCGRSRAWRATAASAPGGG